MAAIDAVGPAGTVTQTTLPTAAQRAIFDAVGVKMPPRFLDIHPAQDGPDGQIA